MSFGADANAHTGFFETVFDIFLPGGDKKNIEDGFFCTGQAQDHIQGIIRIS